MKATTKVTINISGLISSNNHQEIINEIVEILQKRNPKISALSNNSTLNDIFPNTIDNKSRIIDIIV